MTPKEENDVLMHIRHQDENGCFVLVLWLFVMATLMYAPLRNWVRTEVLKPLLLDILK